MAVRLAVRVRALRVDVAPIQDGRTDLLCIVCGKFRTHYELLTALGDGERAHVGIHARCWQMLRVAKRDARRKKRAERALLPFPTALAKAKVPS